jgi:hypothetical protein
MDQEANVMLVYSETTITMINLSSEPLILDGMVFSRTLDNNDQVTTLSFSFWEEIAEGSEDVLLPGECYQILHQTNALAGSPPDPMLLPNCDSLQGWSIADEEDWLFWISGETNEEFQVLQGDRIVHTCSSADDFCKFYLPQP